jgi:hypothetical protein
MYIATAAGFAFLVVLLAATPKVTRCTRSPVFANTKSAGPRWVPRKGVGQFIAR